MLSSGCLDTLFGKGFIFGKLISSPTPLFFFLAFCNYSQCLWDFLFHCLHQVTWDVILDTNQKGKNMTKYCLLQAHVFPCIGLCSGCPPEPGQRLSSSCSKRHSTRCQPQARLLEALEIKMKGEKPVGIFEEAALEVSDLHWRAQWRWQRVLPISLPCVTGILQAPLAAKASQSLKKKESCKCDQLGDAVRLMHVPSSQWITSHWGESSKSLPGEGTWCPPVTLPWRMRNHLLRQGWNWAGAGGHSLPHPGTNAAPTSTPWPESSLSPRKAERMGVAASPKFR